MVCSVLAVSLIGLSCSAAAEGLQTVAQVLMLMDARLAEIERTMVTNDRATRDEATASFSRDLQLLQEKTIMIFAERKRHWDTANGQVGQALTKLMSASPIDRPESLAETVKGMREAWNAMKLQYPREALDILPPLWTCPMHLELMEPDAGSCKLCGMPLEPIYLTQPQLSREPLIRAEIVSGGPLVVGKQANLRIRLIFNRDGNPVHLEDLEVAHTRRIHLLIVDLSQTDYHHEHPEPAGDGEYAFSFVPTRPGPYRVWADLKPVRTHIQQYSIADIFAASNGQSPQEELETRETEVNGYKFRLSFQMPVIQAGSTVLGTMHVTGPDGEPCTKLEVVMGAFGHFVGFCEDYSTVLHIHPIGAQLDDLSETRGGPDLQFYFRCNQPGVIRLFTQVQLDGRNLFPRFIVKVRARTVATQ